ncbi:MAG: hypothetical protein WCF84_25480 [Anaerolineae bacterium]
MDLVFVALRLTHIVAGMFWVGAAVLNTVFLMPAARALGPEGGRFMQFVLGKLRLSSYIALSAILTTLAGIVLYWRASGGLQPTWIFTTGGLIFTIGAVTGIAAAILGGVETAPAATRMEALAQEMESAGGPPRPEQLVQLQNLQAHLGRSAMRGMVLLVITIIAMAIA